MKLTVTPGLYFLIAVWIIVQSIFLNHHGIAINGEPEKYISQAHNFLATGALTLPSFWLYCTQIFLLAFAFKLGLGFPFVLAIQLFFSAWATVSLYRLARSLFSATTAFIGTLLFLLNYPFQEFNVYLQTESLFFSFTIIYSSWLLRLSKLTISNAAIILLLLVLICITRPSGILWVPATFLYLFFTFLNGISTRKKIIIASGTAIIFLFVLNSILNSGGGLNFMLPFLNEQIICEVTTLHQAATIKTVPNGNSIYGLLYYITHNFDQFSHLAFLRSKAFFGLQRTYYGTGHNIFLALFFYTLYVTTALSLKWWLKNNRTKLLYLSGMVLITWITALLTCDDWHNRFFLTISPYLIVLSLPVINKLANKLGYK